MPSVSCAAAATLSTAAPSVHLVGERRARLRRRHLVARDHENGLDTLGRFEPDRRRDSVRLRTRADDEAAVERRADVVGMAFQLDRPGVDLLLAEPQLVQVVGRQQAGQDRRRARSQPAGKRDLAADLEAQAVGRVERLERPHAEVRAVGGDGIAPGVDHELALLGNLQLEVQGQGRGEDVEAGAQVRRGSGDADQPAALRHEDPDAPISEPERPAIAPTR